MDRWLNRVAVVTGAGGGIGSACCKDLLNRGMIVVGLDLREIRMLVVKDELSVEQASRFHYRKCDVSNEQNVIEAFAWIDKQLGGADVLVNNAGIIRSISLTDQLNSRDVRATVEVNVLGVAWCTREMFLSLQRRKVNDGHVVIMNSLAGHEVPVVPGASLNMYSPTKHAMTALTEVLRQEFLIKGTNTKITSISPAAVDTEIFDGYQIPNPETFPMLRAENVADAIGYCIQTPPNVQIHELTIRPIGG